jgi:chromosome segregation ATPase
VTAGQATEARIAALEAELEKTRKERDFLRAAYEALKRELELLKRRIFIAKAERVDHEQLKLEFQDKLALLNQLADTLEEPKPDAQDDTEPDSPTKPGKDDRRKKRKTSPTGRRRLEGDERRGPRHVQGLRRVRAGRRQERLRRALSTLRPG